MKRMHCHSDLEYDLRNGRIDGFLSDGQINRWIHDRYSTSKLLPLLHALVVGLNAKKVGEVGVGRSTFVFLNALKKIGGRLTTCDREDYRLLLSPEEAEITTYILGDSEKFFKTGGYDLIFLDCLSSRKISVAQAYKTMKRSVSLLKLNGLLCVHDAHSDKYNVAEALRLLGKKHEAIVIPFCYGLGIVRNTKYKHHGVVKDVWNKKPNTDKI